MRNPPMAANFTFFLYFLPIFFPVLYFFLAFFVDVAAVLCTAPLWVARLCPVLGEDGAGTIIRALMLWESVWPISLNVLFFFNFNLL